MRQKRPSGELRYGPRRGPLTASNRIAASTAIECDLDLDSVRRGESTARFAQCTRKRPTKAAGGFECSEKRACGRLVRNKENGGGCK